MHRKNLLSALAVMSLFPAFLHAQSITPLTLDDVIPGGRTWQEKHPRSPRILGAVSGGLLVYNADRIDLMKADGRAEPFLEAAEWQKMSGALLRNLPPFVPAEKGTLLTAYSGNRLYLLDAETKALTTYEYDRTKWSDAKISPSGDYLVLLDGQNMALLRKGGTEPVPVTTDGSLDLVYGQSAARNEFGTDRGIFFSPSGRYFAFYRIDQSEVAAYPIVHMERPIAELAPEKYPMAGGASQKTTVGIFDTRDGSIRYLETGAPFDRYFTNLSWAPDEKRLYIDEVTRDQAEDTLTAYDIKSGKPVQTVLRETNERYIEPQQPIAFVPGAERQFVRLSRKDGFNNLYLYDVTGKLVRPLTLVRNGEVTGFLGIDPKGRYAYYTSNAEDPRYEDLYRVRLNDGTTERLTTGEGTHRVTVSNDFAYAYDAFSNLDTPGVYSVIELGAKPVTTVFAKSDLPSDLSLRPSVELGVLKADDGVTDLYYKLTKPAKLEKGKKYPVIVYVYGGPHAQLVTNSWNSLRYNWDNYMAEKDYLVFTLDNRGSANRGFDFESVVHRNLGEHEMADQMTGIKFLKSLPYVDADKIGVHGWSFGGFMTTNLITTYPETFKVGVAGGPVIDWRLYEVMYGERYMDTPEENPEGYKNADLTRKAKNLKGRLLLIHGAIDPVVVWQNSQDFLNAAIEARTLPDYLVYPNHPHNVIGKDRVHLMMHVTRYFDDFLKGR